MLVVRSGKYHEDKKSLKLDRKQARKLMKQMQMQNKNLTIKEMKRAQLTFTFDPGEGSGGKLFLLLIVKLIQFLYGVVTYPFRKKEEKEKFTDIEFRDDNKE